MYFVCTLNVFIFLIVDEDWWINKWINKYTWAILLTRCMPVNTFPTMSMSVYGRLFNRDTLYCICICLILRSSLHRKRFALWYRTTKQTKCRKFSLDPDEVVPDETSHDKHPSDKASLRRNFPSTKWCLSDNSRTGNVYYDHNNNKNDNANIF